MTSENEERTETETEEKRPDQECCEQTVLWPLIDRMIELGVLPDLDLDIDPETRDK